MTLDEQVAVALGWKNHVTYGWYPPDIEEGRVQANWALLRKPADMPDFSANWRRLEEMLDWLRDRSVVRVTFYTDSVKVDAYKKESLRCLVSADGKTLPEVLALAVVGVVEWQKAQEATR